MTKSFYLSADKHRDLTNLPGGAVATDYIMCSGFPVGFMYREEPDHDMDNGWRFMSGYEDQKYMDVASNHGIYNLNSIANIDPDIVEFLNYPVGSSFERSAPGEPLRQVFDFNSDND